MAVADLRFLSQMNEIPVSCATLPEGCDGGAAHDAVLRRAIARFTPNAVFGGRQDTLCYAIDTNSTLASIAYTCSDGSVPPRLSGATAQTPLNRILNCPNRCGGVSLPDNSKCGFGVLMASNATTETCFSKAIDLTPETGVSTVKQSVGSFVSWGCRTDSTSSRALTGGSGREEATMTVEGCVQLAQGFRFADVEFGLRGCFADSAAARILRADSATDTSSTAVEPCIAFASAGYWRYAAVEAGTQCFVGNTLRSASSAPADDCTAARAGNPLRDVRRRRAAGQPGNRAQVYEDTAWKDPTRDELAALVRNCHEAMAQGADIVDSDRLKDPRPDEDPDRNEIFHPQPLNPIAIITRGYQWQ
ncbi:hypothetical protein B0T24DRAFT_715888 [Lasiosphaeria ovina]|uniref:WSC domain-containing protein n=1 Tax=Lasiosphaeria ovina TaxID=92902 RepID=A0AAE0TYJ7_9PEZI|nr:hypothetical protein B0T24DRAFT_715888 [Lasiosphaeria ovina]